MMKKLLTLTLIVGAIVLSAVQTNAQRKMETLTRGVVAVKSAEGIFVSWRIFGEEWYGVTYNLYRNGTKLNAEPLQVSNYVDAAGTLSSEYTVSAIIKGQEQAQSIAVTPWAQQYKEIPLKPRNTSYYEINDATTADLDGDGEYEIIVKRLNRGYYYGNDSTTYFEAYELDGTFMWEINAGPNIYSSGGVEINIAAFDFDGDGKSEVFMRTSDGTVFGDGTNIGDRDNDGIIDYRPIESAPGNMEYPTAGPEYLSLIDGETGAELDWVNYIPRGRTEDWGDGYGHRANKFFFGAPYLDGKKPSIFISRGIYTKIVMRAYDVVDKKLVAKWQFSSENNPGYGYQGNHNYTIADVDEDGRDEIVYGGMTVDDDGTGLYTTEMGHGDALHVGDLDPFRKGIEIWRCLENSPMYGTSYYDGATGELLIHDVLGRDCGRCMAANISNSVDGATMWGSTTMFSATTKKPVNVQGNSVNFRIYWDGDLLEELLDHNWNGGGGEGVIQKSGSGNIFTATGTNSCNWTKGTPSLQADLFGDWREEVIWRTTDDRKIRIYTTVDPTIHRNYTLMHDHQYRQGICWQMCGYNQPPHASYFLGEREGITVPPPPVITNGRLVFNGGGVWDSSTSNWLDDGESITFKDGDHVLFDVSNGEDVSLTLGETVSPEIVTINSPGDYTINASSGKLSGDMKLVKQGLGNLVLDGSHDFTGVTEIWNGRLSLDGELSGSPVWVNRFGELSAKGELGKGVNMGFASGLYVGGENSFTNLSIKDSLKVANKATLVYDAKSTPEIVNDTLKVDGDLILQDGAVIKVVPHLQEGELRLSPGSYVLATATGEIVMDVNKIVVEGILGTASELKIENKSLILEIKDMRSAGAVVWNGSNSNEWDLVKSANFLMNGAEDVFVTGDEVEINDDAVEKSIVIAEDVSPAKVVVNNETEITISGNYGISGDATLTKTGSGRLSLTNNNSLTGKVTLNEGTLRVNSLPNNIDPESAIGPVTSNPSLFEINGGTLAVSFPASMDRAMTIGANGATIDHLNDINWNGRIVGENLIKTGKGTLILGAANNYDDLTIKDGTVRLLNEEANENGVGSKVIFEKGTLAMYDNSGSYSNCYYDIEVAEGNTGNLRCDSRIKINGALTGAGRLNVFIPFVRTDFHGDWSGFTGMINISADSDGGDFRVFNNYGYGNAQVVIGSNVNFYVESSSKSDLDIGELILYNNATLGGKTGTFTLRIGAKNTNSLVYGTIRERGNTGLIKVGTGDLTLRGANLYRRYTQINGGAIICDNSSGSATGLGPVSVNENGTLKGDGSVSGAVNVNNGGTLEGKLNIGGIVRVAQNGTVIPGGNQLGTITLNSNANFSTGSALKVDVIVTTETSDMLKVSGTVSLAGILHVKSAGGAAFKEGNRFKIIEANSISGMFEGVEPATPGEGLRWDFSEIADGYVKVSVETGVEDAFVNAIEITPNPTNGEFVLHYDEFAQAVEYSISDLQGRVLQSGMLNATQKTLSLKGEASGVYMIQIKDGDKKITKRIILQ